ncbi:MAG: HAD family hydrolase [Oscillospiraceae bacterium]|nr:HAD family hydrolase [Oscillospiraceae bacterium]
MKLRAVIFDLDNTLYDYDAAHATAFRALCAFAGKTLDLPEAEFRTVYREVMDEQISRAGGQYAAIHNRMIRFQMILERLKKPVLYAPDMSDVYWDAFLNACQPVPGVRETLESLRGAYIIGIGTNMTADYQFRKLQTLGLLDLIDFLVSSEEVGVEKPERKLFEVCAEKAGCPAGECLFVGDSLTHDVRGALDAGMSAVWLSTKSAPDGVERIADISALPDFLRRKEGGTP